MPGMGPDLAGRRAIVTGAASGIGAGIAAVLGEAGATIVLVDRDGDGLDRETARLAAAGHRAEAVRIDLACEDSIVAGCAEILAGGPVPWLLVNNAGLQDREALLDVTVAEWDRMLAVNARGPLLMIRELGRAMVTAGQGGRIVNIASNAVLAPMVVGHAAYTASKAALIGLSIPAAFELVGHGITVNTILPGGVATPGARAVRGPASQGPARDRSPPLGRCEPADIAAAVLFFASPAARRITNQTIAVDGGFSLT